MEQIAAFTIGAMSCIGVLVVASEIMRSVRRMRDHAMDNLDLSLIKLAKFDATMKQEIKNIKFQVIVLAMSLMMLLITMFSWLAVMN